MHHLITLLLLFIFLRLGVLGAVLEKLALSSWEIQYGMLMLILLSLVNVRLCRLRVPPVVADDTAEGPSLPDRDAGHNERPPAKITIGINLGGAILPLFFGLYLSRHQPLELAPLLLLVLLVALVVYPLSRVSGRRGVVVHLAGAIAVAAVGAVLLGGPHYLVWAYLGGVLGTLLGADLLHLSQLMYQRNARQRGIFIGGAGLMDAIFLSGLFAMLTAELLQQHDLLHSLF